ncbi:MAG: hypothetical protein ACK52N_12120 [Lysobacteraceae bacterium]
MREVYRSLRIEQVEGASTMLREAGIETSLQNGRSDTGGRRRSCSYRDTPDSPNATILYVTHNGDLPEARRLLREAGLMEPGQRESYLSPELQFRQAESSPKRGLDVRRIRTILLLLIVVVVGLFTFAGPWLAGA